MRACAAAYLHRPANVGEVGSTSYPRHAVDHGHRGKPRRSGAEKGHAECPGGRPHGKSVDKEVEPLLHEPVLGRPRSAPLRSVLGLAGKIIARSNAETTGRRKQEGSDELATACLCARNR